MKPATPCLLTINGGSSSIKFALFEAGHSLRRTLHGAIDRIGEPQATFHVEGLRACEKFDGQAFPSPAQRGKVPQADGGALDPAFAREKRPLQPSGQLPPLRRGSESNFSQPLSPADGFSRSVTAPDHTAAAGILTDWIEGHVGRAALAAIGHRVVQGGPKYSEPQLISDAMITELRRLVPFDPEHLPEEILLIEAIRRRFPDLPQVACFDTAFHRSLPRVARLLSIPRRYEAQGVRRYGFHGLSYAFLMEELARLGDPAAASGRVILAHLGSGASLAAVRDGQSADTSMGFTPASGVPMSTRSGDLDPGLLGYLAREEDMSAEQFNAMINFQSGLLGVSETSADMRDLLDREAQDVRAAEAVALFCYEVKKRIGAFAAVLGGLDTLVFAGGIGENAPPVRERICAGLGFLGIELDPARNARHAPLISTDAGRVTVRVIHTDEELVIARSLSRVLKLGCGNPTP